MPTYHTASEALAEAAQKDAELASYYEFQRALFELREKVREEITATLELADSAALQARVSEGRPQLSFAQLPIEAERFVEQAATIARLLSDYYGPEGDVPLATPGVSIAVTKEELPADAAEWISLAQRRFAEGQAVSGKPDKETDVALAETVVDQALQPYLEWAAEQVLPQLDQQQWLRSYCPVCGGAPDLAFLSDQAGARHLVCSRCNSQWLSRRLGCPFCQTDDQAQFVYYPSEDGVYRLYVCGVCRRYLKTIDQRQVRRPVLREVERITTVAMDVAARQAGYR